jgi:hypothetical protein
LQRWPKELGDGGHASRPSILAPSGSGLVAWPLVTHTPPKPHITLRRTPPHETMYVNARHRMRTSTVTCVGVCRLLHRRTARDGQHSEWVGASAYVDSRCRATGLPFASTPVASRPPVTQPHNTVAGTTFRMEGCVALRRAPERDLARGLHCSPTLRPLPCGCSRDNISDYS